MIRDTRGVSEVLGYILVFALVLASIALVSTVGLGQIQDVRDVEQMNNAEDAFDLLATNIDDIALRGAPSRSTEMQLATGQLEITEPITIRFKGINESGGTEFNESYDVRPIRYRGSGQERAVFYTGGAVFRMNEDRGTIVRESPLVASDGRITIPLVHTRASSVQSRGGGTARLRASHAQTLLLASDTTGSYETVYMNVTSPRAQQWMDNLKRHDEFTCSLDQSGGTDVAECRAQNPERVHIALVQIDVALHN